MGTVGTVREFGESSRSSRRETAKAPELRSYLVLRCPSHQIELKGRLVKKPFP